VSLRFPAPLPLYCFYGDCPARVSGPNPGRFVRRGFFSRISDLRLLQRFLCKTCRRSFSEASFSPCYGQKRRTLNEPIRSLLGSGSTLRRIARNLRTDRKTVTRKMLFLETLADARQQELLSSLEEAGIKIGSLQFDEMETFEHTKCKPLSIPMVVLPGSRKILALDVCQMPASGRLAEISRRKYGPRPDERADAAHRVLSRVKGLLDPTQPPKILTDQKPQYPSWLRRALGDVEHRAYKGRRPRAAGLGELKKGGYDPLFSYNHTAAMIRANVSRLFRKTWNTTKRRDRLRAHLAVYADFHNFELTPAF
jgi:hypothetical protein